MPWMRLIMTAKRHSVRGLSMSFGNFCKISPPISTKRRWLKAHRTIRKGIPVRRKPSVVPNATRIATGKEMKSAIKMGT